MTTERSGMSLSEAISSVEVRNEMRGDSGRYPNGEGWGHCYGVDGFWIPKKAWETIRSNLSRDAVVSYPAVFTGELDGVHVGLHGSVESVEALSSFAARHAAVPDGYVLVPVDPTEAMIQAYLDCQETDPEDASETYVYNGYKAMLAQRDGG